MKAKMQWLLVVSPLLFFPFAAFADPVIPETDTQLHSVALQLYDLVVNKHYAMALGPLLAVLVALLRRYDVKIPKYGAQIDAFLNRPFVAYALPTAVSVLGGLGTALAAHQPLVDALRPALEASSSAVLAYVGLKKWNEDPTVAPPAPPAQAPVLAAVPEVKS